MPNLFYPTLPSFHFGKAQYANRPDQAAMGGFAKRPKPSTPEMREKAAAKVAGHSQTTLIPKPKTAEYDEEGAGGVASLSRIKKTAAILPKVAMSPVGAVVEAVGGKAEYEEGGGERQKFRHAGKETPLSDVLKKFGSYRKTFKHKDAEIETAHHPDMTPQDHKILAEAHRDLQSHYADKVNHHLGVRPSDNTAMAHGKAAEHHESLSGKSGQ